jgi:hypothetical protein
MISGTGNRGIGISTTTNGDPYLRLYDNTTIKADIWWDRASGHMGINSLTGSSKTAINPNGGNVLIGTTTDTGGDRRLQVAGDLFVNDNTTTGNGVQLKSADRPLITRGWDAFTSGTKTGVGRWGLYMEPAELFLGSPGTDYANCLVSIGGYLVNGTKQSNLTVNNYTRSVGIGTSNPIAALQVSAIPSTNGDSVYQIVPFDTNTATSRVGAGISFGGYYNGTTDYTSAFASIKGFKENLTNNDYAGALAFMTRVNGGSSTERMRITSGGNLLIGTGATDVGSLIHAYTTENRDNMVYTNTNASLTYAIFAAKTTRAGGTSCYFYYGEANSVTTYRVYNNGNVQNTNNSYTGISDISIKENILDATPKLADLLKVRVVNYNLKAPYENHKQLGVVAQELEKIFPNMIDIDGNTKLKSVKYSIFVPMLIKAVQELKAEIETLKNK